MDDEFHLIESAKHGDTAAFESLVKSFGDRICRYVRHIVGDEHVAEDLAQRVFLGVHKNLDRYDRSKGKVATWIYRIARNTALNHLRDHKPLEFQFDTPIPEASTSTTPESIATLKEQFALLDRALAELPITQRQVWVLFELEGMTQVEIAELEDIPEGTVKSRLSRARSTLRETLSGQFGLER